jgi:hypothetical protein
LSGERSIGVEEGRGGKERMKQRERGRELVNVKSNEGDNINPHNNNNNYCYDINCNKPVTGQHPIPSHPLSTPLFSCPINSSLSCHSPVSFSSSSLSPFPPLSYLQPLSSSPLLTLYLSHTHTLLTSLTHSPSHCHTLSVTHCFSTSYTHNVSPMHTHTPSRPHTLPYTHRHTFTHTHSLSHSHDIFGGGGGQADEGSRRDPENVVSLISKSALRDSS